MSSLGSAVLVLTGHQIAVHHDTCGKHVAESRLGFVKCSCFTKLGLRMKWSELNSKLLDLSVADCCKRAPLDQRIAINILGLEKTERSMAYATNDCTVCVGLCDELT